MPSALQTAYKTGLIINRGSHTIKLTRDFDAGRTQIFEAWTNPEHVT